MLMWGEDGFLGRCKMTRGSRLKGQRVVGTPDDEEDGSLDEDVMDMSDEDSAGRINLKFTSFKAEDISNPCFKVGMIFESVDIVRNDVIEYSMKNRIDIKMLRNDKRRVRAHCAEGCPWSLYASYDSRARAFMVTEIRTYNNFQ